jgi:multiple sugar transport system substrate-binding protein
MYDPLYERIPAFERESGLAVEVVVQAPHPELNAWVDRAFTAGDPDIDLLSTHTKYAPSQAQWLAPLDEASEAEHIADLHPKPLELSRINGQLLQLPRNIDVRLLHYRRDLLETAPVDDAGPPKTWTELADRAAELTSSAVYGFVFPGRDSGLFGTFYELLVGAGGELFESGDSAGELRAAFDSPEGVWAASYLADLHLTRRVTPRELPSWHYDEISAAFRAGKAAMVCDWPGSYHLYRESATCACTDSIGLAPLPAGPAGVSAAYGGCHSFAISSRAHNAAGGLSLLRYLTSFEAQIGEARLGSIPCRLSAMEKARNEAASHAVDAHRLGLLSDAVETMIVPPRFSAYPRCEDAIWRAVQQAMTGERSPAEAVRKAADDILRLTRR